MIFKHEFNDESDGGSLSFDTDAMPPARIKLEVDADGDVWIRANPEGWLHLARICAELGMGNYEHGYHFHKDQDFQWSTGAPEFTFMVDKEL